MATSHVVVRYRLEPIGILYLCNKIFNICISIYIPSFYHCILSDSINSNFFELFKWKEALIFSDQNSIIKISKKFEIPLALFDCDAAASLIS